MVLSIQIVRSAQHFVVIYTHNSKCEIVIFLFQVSRTYITTCALCTTQTINIRRVVRGSASDLSLM